VCRSSERALMVRVEYHPDSRSRALWSTAFGATGQGELFGDVVSFADDAEGRQQLLDAIVADVVAWATAGFSIKVGAGDYT
jgi:hypothetical protein